MSTQNCQNITFLNKKYLIDKASMVAVLPGLIKDGAKTLGPVVLVQSFNLKIFLLSIKLL